MYTPNIVKSSMYVAGIIRSSNRDTLQAVLTEIDSAEQKVDRMHELIAGAEDLPGLQALLLNEHESYDWQTEIELEQIEAELDLTRDEIREGLRTDRSAEEICSGIKQTVADYMQAHINRSLKQTNGGSLK